MNEWLAGWLAVISAIKLYGIGQPNEVFAAIKTTLNFLSFLLALVSFVFVFVLRAFATHIGETIYLALKYFLALIHISFAFFRQFSLFFLMSTT